MLDNGGDAWSPGSWIRILGSNGNTIFKGNMIEPSRDIAYFSLYTPLPRSSVWEFYRGSVSSSWINYEFDDSSWTELQLGSVSISYSGTQYLRRKFVGTMYLSAYELQLRYRFGIVAYVNGVEVYRDHLPDGPTSSSSLAIGEYNTYSYHSVIRPASEVASESNIVAVELHFPSLTTAYPMLFNSFLSMYAHTRSGNNCFIYGGLYQSSISLFDYDISTGEVISQPPMSFSYPLISDVYVNGVAVWYEGGVSSTMTAFQLYRIENETPVLVLDVDSPSYLPQQMNMFITSGEVQGGTSFRLNVESASSLPLTLTEVQLMTCSLNAIASIPFPQSSYIYDIYLEEVDIRPSIPYLTDCYLSTTLPQGLSFNSSTCSISGIPSANLPETMYTMSTSWGGSTIQGGFTLRITNFNNHRYLLVRKMSQQYASRESFSIFSNGIAVVNSSALYNGLLQEFVYTIPRSVDDQYELVMYHTTSHWYAGSWIELVTDDDTIVFKGFMTSSLEEHHSFSLYCPVSSSSVWSTTTTVTSMAWYMPLYDISSWDTVVMDGQLDISGIPRYYRLSFSGMNSMAAYQLNLNYRYGIIAYLAGTEIFRDQLPEALVPNTLTTSLSGYSSYDVHRVIRNGNEVNDDPIVLAIAFYFPSLSGSYILNVTASLHLIRPSIAGTLCSLYPYGSSSESSTNDFSLDSSVTFNSFPRSLTYSFDATVLVNGLGFWFTSMNQIPSAYRVEGSNDNSIWRTIFDHSYEHNMLADVISFVSSTTYKHIKTTVLSPALEQVVVIAELHPLVCYGSSNTISYESGNQILFVDQKITIQPTLLGYTGCSVYPELPPGLSITSDCTIEGIPTAATAYQTYYVSAGVNQGSLMLTVRNCAGSIVKFTRTYQSESSSEGFVVINNENSNVILHVPLQSSTSDFTEWSSTLCLSVSSYTLTLLSSVSAWKSGSFLYVTATLPDGEEDELLRARFDPTIGIPANYLFSTEYLIPARSSWYYRMGSIPTAWYNSDMSGWGYSSVGSFPSSTNQLQLYKLAVTISNIDYMAGFTMLLRHQYGYVIMVNGAEVFRYGVRGSLSTSSAATTTSDLFYHSIYLPIRFLNVGSNVFAIAIVTPSSTVRTSVFDCSIRLDSSHSTIVSSRPLNSVGVDLLGYPTRIFEDSSEFFIGSDQCTSNSLDITFANERQEWMNTMVLRRMSGYAYPMQVIISGLVDGTWNRITTVSSINWQSDGTATISIPQTTSTAYNALRLTNINTGSSMICQWRLQQILLVAEASSTLPSLEYPEIDTIVLYVPIEPIHPLSSGFTSYSITPDLPLGLRFDLQTGEISGTASVATDFVNYVITAKVNSEDRIGSTTIIGFSVMVCGETQSLVSLHVNSNEPKFILYRGETVIASSEEYNVMGTITSQPSVPPDTILSSNVEHTLYFCLPYASYSLHFYSSTASGWSTSSYYYLSLDNNNMKFEGGYVSTSEHIVEFSSYTPFQVISTVWKIYKATLSSSSWIERGYDDSYWTSSLAADIGSSTAITIYIRRTFSLSDLSSYSLLNVRVTYIGGVVAYMNGRQWARFNLVSPFTSTTRGTILYSSSHYSLFHIILTQANVNTEGNVMAFEVHRATGESTSSSFVFDATGLITVAECSIAMDSYMSTSGTTPSEGSISSYFDYDPSTYAVISSNDSPTVNWEVENMVGTTFSSFAILERTQRSSLSFDVRARITTSDVFAVLLSLSNQHLPAYTRSQWAMRTSLSTYRIFRLSLNGLVNNGIDASNIYFQYCKGDMMELLWYYQVTEGAVPNDWTTSTSLSWPTTEISSFPAATSITQYYQGVTSLLYLPFYHHIIITLTVKAGVILYLNGNELLRVNLPITGVTSQTSATAEHASPTTYIFCELTDSGNPRLGENMFAAEMHRYLTNESTNSFSLSVEYVEDNQRSSDAASTSTDPVQEGENGSVFLFDNNPETVTIIPNQCVGVTALWDFTTRYEVVNKIVITNGPDHNEWTPSGWKFYGRRDDSEWVLLQLHSNVTFTSVSETREFEVTNIVAYNQYKIIFAECNSDTFQLADIALYSHTQTGNCPASFDFLPTANGDNAWNQGDGCNENYDGGYARRCEDGQWSESFLLCLVRGPTSIEYNSTAFEVRTNRPITPITPVISAIDYTVSIQPSLPPGLMFNTSNGEITGLPTELSSPQSYTVEVSNPMGSITTVITLHVIQGPIDCKEEDGLPIILDGETAPTSCPTYYTGWVILQCLTGVKSVLENHCELPDSSFGLALSSLSLTLGEPIPPLSVVYSLPEMEFSISPDLPQGVTFTNGTFGGALNTTFTSDTFTITGSVSSSVMTDALQDLDTPEPLLQVVSEEPVTFSTFLTLSARPCPQEDSYPQTPSGETASITSHCPPYTSGHSTRFCRSGVWDDPQHDCTALPVTDFQYSPSSLTVQRGETVHFSVQFTGIVSSFSSNPPLPEGLEIISSGDIVGVPSQAQSAQQYTITASTQESAGATTVVSLQVTNASCRNNDIIVADGETISQQCDGVHLVAVQAECEDGEYIIRSTESCPVALPTNLRYSSNAYTATMNVPFSTHFPLITGVNVTFEVDSALPEGLSLNPLTGEISGIPTVASSVQNYTISAINPAGSVTTLVSFTVIPQQCQVMADAESVNVGNVVIIPCNETYFGELRLTCELDETLEVHWSAVEGYCIDTRGQFILMILLTLVFIVIALLLLCCSLCVWSCGVKRSRKPAIAHTEPTPTPTLDDIPEEYSGFVVDNLPERGYTLDYVIPEEYSGFVVDDLPERGYTLDYIIPEEYSGFVVDNLPERGYTLDYVIPEEYSGFVVDNLPKRS